MSDLPVIASMWIGPQLSFLEQLCLKSFADAGHRTKLYVYDEVKGVPEGVEVADAQEILPSTKFILHGNSGNPGPHSDRFRYELLSKSDEIWVDTDAYCMKPFPDEPIVVARHHRYLVANGVLRLPRDSQTLRDLQDFTAEEYPLLPDDFVVAKPVIDECRARHGTDNPMHISEMPWEIWGPFALTYFMKKNGIYDDVMPRHSLYPLSGAEIVRVLQKPYRAKIRLPEDCISVHFYGSRFRKLVIRRGGIPLPQSFFGQLLKKHEIDPNEAPIIL